MPGHDLLWLIHFEDVLADFGGGHADELLHARVKLEQGGAKGGVASIDIEQPHHFQHERQNGAQRAERLKFGILLFRERFTQTRAGFDEPEAQSERTPWGGFRDPSLKVGARFGNAIAREQQKTTSLTLSEKGYGFVAVTVTHNI